MKLVYRGVAYDYNPPEVLYGVPIASGAYRGSPIKFRTPKTLPVEQPSLNLKYRHVAYTTQPNFPTAHAEADMSQHAALDTSEWAEPNAAIATSESTDATDSHPSTEAVSDAAPTTSRLPISIQERARFLMMRHHVKVTQREEDMLGRLFAEIGVPEESAAHHAGRIQGKIYPQFWTSYDRSHASMS